MAGPSPRYAAAVLRSVEGGTRAALVLLPPTLEGARIVDLDRVHGDAPVPRVAASGGDLVIAVADTDASGGSLRLGHVAAGMSTVAWGLDLHEGDDESKDFDLALAMKLGVLVWDDWSKKQGHGVIRRLVFNKDATKEVAPPGVVSPEADDAESPRAARRPAGFWLTWLSRANTEPEKPSERDEPERTLRPPERWVVVQQLDTAANALGEPLAITPKQGHVVGYDIGVAQDGTLLVVTRDGVPAIGVEGGIVKLTRVRADGSVTDEVLLDREVGAGMPSFLPSQDSKSANDLWLTLTNDEERTSLARFGAAGDWANRPQEEAALSDKTLIARIDEQLLVGQPDGRNLMLSLARCQFEKASPTASP